MMSAMCQGNQKAQVVLGQPQPEISEVLWWARPSGGQLLTRRCKSTRPKKKKNMPGTHAMPLLGLRDKRLRPPGGAFDGALRNGQCSILLMNVCENQRKQKMSVKKITSGEHRKGKKQNKKTKKSNHV